MNINYTTQFKKDYKKINKQNKNINKLRAIIDKLTSGKKLEPKYKDHQLTGNWSGHRDCHIEADWILIYSTSDEDLNLERIGSHSELFKK